MLTLRPIDPDDPPEGLFPRDEARGIAIYWRLSSSPFVTRRRRRNAKTPAPVWQVQRIGFHAVSPNGEDEPPRDADEQARCVRLAYALIACKHPIPSDADVRYRVWW